jgi:hypothetical protein
LCLRYGQRPTLKGQQPGKNRSEVAIMAAT